MVVNLSFEHPFHGIVFSEGHFDKDECVWRGNEGHYLLVVIPLDYSNNSTTSLPLENQIRGFCGLKFDQVRFKLVYSIEIVAFLYSICNRASLITGFRKQESIQ